MNTSCDKCKKEVPPRNGERMTILMKDGRYLCFGCWKGEGRPSVGD